MHHLLLFLFFSIIALFYSCDHVVIHEIPGPYIYTIKEHGDSLYYSTPDGSVLRLSPETPEEFELIASKKGYPLRSLAFTTKNDLYASSYASGVYRVLQDSLEAIPFAWQSAWSMKLDSAGNIWLASNRGVYKQTNDTLVRFTNLNGAYDIEFFNGLLAVAHRKGISFYNLQSGEYVRSICKDTIFWSIQKIDTLLIGGGVESCVLLGTNTHKIIPLGPKNNIPWASVLDNKGTIYLATQMGLYQIKPGSRKAKCIGYKGKCIKSVFIDSKDRLWVGKYFRK